MTFKEVLAQVIEWLHQDERVSYRALKRQFDLDDDYLEDLKEELIFSKRLATDEENRVLVWTGVDEPISPPPAPPTHEATPPASEREPLSYTPPHLAEKILTSRSALEGERKQVTVLFCDLVNSTAIAEAIGPESMHTLLNRFFEVSLEHVHHYEGTINQFLGDGFMALYGAPLALEDHGRRGVLAALKLQHELQEANLGQPYNVTCQFRMGLNSGLVVVGSIGDNLRMDYSAIGDTTNLAARLQGAAEPGDIVISESTCRLVQDDVRLEALQPVLVKGKAQPVNPYKVVGVRPRRSPILSRGERVLSQFVGREREMATLDALFTQVELGRGQVVGIVAEAGQGKSRLLYEFRQHLQDKPVTYLEGRCLPHSSNSPYYPVIDMVRHYIGITETQSPKAIIDKVRVALQDVHMDAQASSPYVLQLLGVQEGLEPLAELTPAAVRARTFETLRHMILNASQESSLVLVIEDLHWLDNTSEAFLLSLMDDLSGAPILLLATYRPGYRPPWADKSTVTQLSLPYLAAQDALTVVRSAHRQALLSDAAAQMIVTKAEGNPFFLEELTRVVLEQAERPDEVSVPDTIQGVLMARIDRLPDRAKRLLQTASVLGREFSPSLLGAIQDDTDAMESVLVELKQLEFLYERIGRDEPIYIFKHALTQEVAYESLLTTRRQSLHRSTGHALERLHHDSLTERYEELAHHFRVGEVWDKAFDYLLKSGDKARQAFANPEAIAFYTHAIEISDGRAPELDAAQRLPVHEGRGQVCILLSQYDEAIADFQTMHNLARLCANSHKEGVSLYQLARAYEQKLSEEAVTVAEQYAQEALQLAHRSGDQKVLAMSLAALGNLDAIHGDLREAEKKSETALAINRRESDKSALVFLLFLLSKLAYWQSHFQPAIQFGQEGMVTARDIYDGNNELANCFMLSLACWGGGHYARALNVLQEGLTKAKERKSMMNVIRLTNSLGWFYREFGDISRAMGCDLESVEMGRTYGFPDPEISALINLGLDYLALGEHERALSYLEPTLQRVEYEAFGAHRWRWKIRLFTGLAELFYTRGDDEQAMRYVEDGLREAQGTSSQKYIAICSCLRGKIMARHGETDLAGENLQQALRVAEQVGSPSLIYPIAYDLGQWCAMIGKEREAAASYARAQSAIQQMATAVNDDAMRSTLLSSAFVQEIHEHAARFC